ncbi:hypothetical protein M8J76_008492 [Diaphorina citri]|nr:hypothetical protein M8J76_008492 [Diaphorina citri]
MVKYPLSFLLLASSLVIWVSCSEAEDRARADLLNFTIPTRPPFPPVTGLYKFVQTCENFCDDQFPPGILGIEATKATISCRKGCYTFELFKAMGKKKPVKLIENICRANCKKDYGEESFAGKFCMLGCSKMITLYNDRLKKLRLEIVSKLRQHQAEETSDATADNARIYDEEAEKFMKEHDGMVAEEIDVAVIVDNPKEHSVRFLKSGRLEHVPGFKALKQKIFHVEKLADNPAFQQYLEDEHKRAVQFEEAQKLNSEEKSRDDISIEEERKESVVMKLPSFPKRIETECLLFQIPIYVLTVFVFGIIAIGLWATYGDPADCLFCLSRKFWDKLEYMDTYSTDIDEDDIVAHDRIVTKHIKELEMIMDEGDQDYTCPPPDKDAPPPYVEILTVYERDMKVNK